MELTEALKKIREENLTKSQLEDFRNQLSLLLSEMQVEMAELEKEEAIYMNAKGDNETAINRKITWKGQPQGLRLITLKRHASAVKVMLSSLKDRLYLTY